MELGSKKAIPSFLSDAAIEYNVFGFNFNPPDYRLRTCPEPHNGNSEQVFN
jgi:hypothetical protein